MSHIRFCHDLGTSKLTVVRMCCEVHNFFIFWFQQYVANINTKLYLNFDIIVLWRETFLYRFGALLLDPFKQTEKLQTQTPSRFCCIERFLGTTQAWSKLNQTPHFVDLVCSVLDGNIIGVRDTSWSSSYVHVESSVRHRPQHFKVQHRLTTSARSAWISQMWVKFTHCHLAAIVI